jgi:sugar/nucleoside kinase (ribokinase family)
VLSAVKVGKDGAWIAHDSELHRIEPVTVANVIDTNGAGDAWAAGFLFGHLRGWSLAESGALASLLGSETVLHMGPIIPEAHFETLRPRAMALGPATRAPGASGTQPAQGG